MRHSRLLAASIVALVLAACGGGSGGYNVGPGGNNGGNNSGGNTGGNNPNVVAVTGALTFNPSTLTVPTGTTVTWKWDACTDTGGYGGSGTCVSHNITFDDGSGLTSGTQSSGTFARTFNSVGTYKYHCSIHGADVMSGQVVVQ
ncbi:MAG TPA: plastocyanin/azurin family copper-binding protein [Gemmatimonadaceae bacterium]|nr:plastocyanin/azurin family copper-binding protein [Gemmatimonadaceae bacterium]